MFFKNIIFKISFKSEMVNYNDSDDKYDNDIDTLLIRV